MAPFPQWIVLVGDDGHLYASKDKVFYQFANSLEKLLQDGIKTNTFYYYPDDNYEEKKVLQKDEEFQRVKQKTNEFIDKKADTFNAFITKLIP